MQARILVIVLSAAASYFTVNRWLGVKVEETDLLASEVSIVKEQQPQIT